MRARGCVTTPGRRTTTRCWPNTLVWKPSRARPSCIRSGFPVEGDGVHEIPVGPVHAGIIEPGHFRFSVVGEKVLRLEERLGYTHKGIEKRFEGQRPLDAALLAARVSGDTTVAFGWAYAMAVESALQLHGAGARAVAAGARAGTRARRQPPGRPRCARQRRRFCVRAGPVFAAEGGLAALERGSLRTPLCDGHRDTGRSAGRSGRGAPGANRPAVRRYRAGDRAAALDLRRARGAAGSFRRRRKSQPGAGGASRFDGSGRPSERAGARSAFGLPLGPIRRAGHGLRLEPCRRRRGASGRCDSTRLWSRFA